MPHTKITQAFVDVLPFHDSTTWFHDTDLAGFNISVGRRSKTFDVGAEHQGRYMRVKIGRADVTKANEARAVARDILIPEIRSGVEPPSQCVGIWQSRKREEGSKFLASIGLPRGEVREDGQVLLIGDGQDHRW